jgi:tetratricopeptide (TPR) repeat protein
MQTIQCTSCKKALEIDEKTLADYGPSTIRCPSCNVTLSVDKRKLKNGGVTGPVVKLAQEAEKPLPPKPAATELASAAENGEYAALLADLYGTADDYLKQVTDDKMRTDVLNDFSKRGHDAMRELRVLTPRASDVDAHLAASQPASHALDEKLQTRSRYLMAVRDLAGCAARLRSHLRAPHRYEPMTSWQAKTRSLLVLTYEAAAKRTGNLAAVVKELLAAEPAYDEVVSRYSAQRQQLKIKIGELDGEIAKTNGSITENETRLANLEAQSKTQGWETAKNSGCGAAVAGAVLSALLGAFIGSNTHSGDAGFFGAVIGFIAGVGIVSYISFNVGSAKNERERSEVLGKLGTLRTHLSTQFGWINETKQELAKLESVAPQPIEAALPPEEWSLLTCNDFDGDGPPLWELAAPRGALGPQQIPIQRPGMTPNASPTAPPPPELPSAAATLSAGAGGVNAPAAAQRAVGFQTHAAPEPMRGGIIFQPAAISAAATLMSVAEAPAVFVPAAPAKPSPRRAIVISAIAVAVLAVVGYLIWQTSFSLRSRLDAALKRNELFAPAGSSVHDLYTAEATTNPASSVLAEFRPKIRAVLEPKGEDAFARWYKDSDDTVSWETMERTYDFLDVMFSQETKFKARKLYAVAQQAIDAKDYAKAIASYEDALKIDPQWALALNGIGKVYMIDRAPMKNERTGVEYYLRACASDPNFTWAPKNLGDYYLRKNDYTSAEQYLLKALATSPERPSILRALGYICRHTHRSPEAIAYYERSMRFEKDPEKNANAAKAIDSIRNGRSGS